MKVWIARGSQTDRHYHADKHCYNFPLDVREMHIEEAQHWFDPCSVCAEDDDHVQRGKQQCECPLCDAVVRDVVTHVRKQHSSDNSPISGANR